MILVYHVYVIIIIIRAGEPEPVGAGAGGSRVFLAPWRRSRLKKKTEPGDTWNKSQEPEPEPLKNYLAPQPSWKIKSIRKLYFCCYSLGKIVSFYCFLAPWSRSRSKKNTRSRRFGSTSFHSLDLQCIQ